MKSRKLFGDWCSKALMGAAALVMAPLLFGGGGDEGVDILPRGNGGFGASGPTGPDASGNQIPHGVRAGYVAVHGHNAALDANGAWAGTGLRLLGHDRSDLFLGLPGQEPSPRGDTGLDITIKGGRKLKYGEFVPSPGVLGSGEFLTLTGRFTVEDLPGDQSLELCGRDRKAALVDVIIGQRGTTSGSISASFTRIDAVVSGIEADGRVDLDEARAELIALYGGTGVDIAIVVSAPVKRGLEEAWAAFNVDEPRDLWDVETKIP